MRDLFPYFAVMAFPIGVFAFVFWQGRVRPALIPHAEIVAIKAALLEKHGQRALLCARIEEDRAWRYSRNFDEGKWRRVRRELERAISDQ